MPDQKDLSDVDVEEHIGLTQPDAFEQTTDQTRVTGRHIFADPKDGKEKEANILDPIAGASSEADPRSGIPSAMTQHGVQREAVTRKEQTPMPNAAENMTQNNEP